MPVYLKPGVRVALVLDIDQKDDPKPTFFAKALTKAEQIELGELIDRLHEGVETTEQLLAKAYQLLDRYIDCWENLPDDFSLENLVYAEVRELLRKLQFGQSLTFEEKKV